MQRKKLLVLLLVCFLLPEITFAQDQPLQEFYRAEVVEVRASETPDETFLVEGVLPVRQRILVAKVLDAPAFTEESDSAEEFTGRLVEVIYDETLATDESQIPQIEDLIVISRNPNLAGEPFIFVDHYRLPKLWMLAMFFMVLILLVAQRRGATALAGLLASVAVIFAYMAPSLIGGASPVFVSVVGSLVIVISSISLAHGISRRTMVAAGSILVTLAITLGLGAAAISFTELLGFGEEAAVHIRLSSLPLQDISGLLLAAIIIGTLGVLDDVAITQATVVEELADVNPDLGLRELFLRGHRVGKEHIAAVVNTLVLAYVGAALPLFVLLYANDLQPLWVLLNGETIAEEVVRTLVGSIGLILAVPISTLLAARVFSKSPESAAQEKPKS